MNKFALAALGVTAVAACNLKPEDRMNEFTFYRTLVGATYNSAIKGMYHEDSARPISEECFGDSLETEMAKVVPILHKLKDDFWSVDLHDAQTVTNTIIDAGYKNAWACQFEKVSDDMKHWCLDNAGECVGFQGIVNRTVENSAIIFSKVLDVYDLMNTDDTCFSDIEIIGESQRWTEDFLSVLSSVRGFDLKWDQKRELTHIKRHSFKKQIKAAAKTLPNIDIWGQLSLPSADKLWDFINHFQFGSIDQIVQYIENNFDLSVLKGLF